MSETATPNQWSEGITLEGIPYSQQPKVIVKVQCYRKNHDFPDYSIPLPVERHDITDWLQANPKEQITILDQIQAALPAGSIDLDDLGDPDELDDATSGDHLVGLDEPGLPAGEDGTDIHIVSAYVTYLKECRDRRFIPFSDISGHEQRTRNVRKAALNTAHEEVVFAVDRYTALARETAAAAGRQALFSDSVAAQHRALWEKTLPLARIHAREKVSVS